jgi:hypothetical protein
MGFATIIFILPGIHLKLLNLSYKKEEIRSRHFLWLVLTMRGQREGGVMKTLTRISCVVILFVIGFAAGFPVGSTIGFTRGSEWALVQAHIIAREAGLFMPVVIEDGIFRVILKQPDGLYTRAWHLADGCDDTMPQVSEKSTKTDEIVYALHDQTAGSGLSSQEVQQTADEIISVSQNPAVRTELSSQEGRQQGADEVGAPVREMSGTVTSATTSTTIATI